MAGDLRTVPLSALSYESRNLLSSLLNAKKIVPVVGPDQISRHRDWRGLASLINISSEVAASIRCNDREDKTDKILSIWSSRNDGSATVGRLLDFLQILDRHDVYDDVLELARDNKLIVQTNRIAYNPVIILDGSDDDFITYDDKLYGTPQRYHAYVLYSRADRDFVDELLRRTRQEGFKMCTEDDLIAGHATPFEPVSRLIAERCRYIVLVYSPDFLLSPAIAFYMNLAQADGISKKQLKIIPVMYRECSLPRHLAYYHNLRYSPPTARAPYDFWDRLAHSLRIVDAPRITMPTTVSHSEVQITETSQSISNGYKVNGVMKTLALPDVPKETTSLTNLHRLSDEIPTSYDTKSLNSSIQSSKEKKSGPFRKIMNTFRGKKQKKAISVEN